MRSSYRKYLFICDSEHQNESWQWNSVISIPCSVKGCRKKASRSIYGTAEAHHRAPRSIYFENSEGHVLLPGNAGDKPPAGYQTRSIENFRDRDKFYKRMNIQLRAEHDEYISREQESHELRQAENRRDLRTMIEQGVPEFDKDGNQTGRLRPMTPSEIDIARASMSTTPADRRKALERMARDNPAIAEKLERLERSGQRSLDLYGSYDPNFFSECWEMDRGSREPWSDRQNDFKKEWY